MIPLLVFDFKERKHIIISCSLPFVSYSISEFFEGSLIPKELTSKPPSSDIFRYANFYGANITSLIFITGFVTRIQHLKFALLEQEKNESESLREAQHLSKIGSWSFDLLTKKNSWSDQMFLIFPESKTNGEPDLERHSSTIHPDDFDEWKSTVDKCINEGIPYTMQFRTFRVNNETQEKEDVWVEAKGRVVRDP